MNVPLTKKRIVALISGSGSNLQALIDSCEAGAIHGSIEHVISNRANAFGLERASNHGISTTTLEHGNFPDRQAFDHALLDTIEALKPDLVVLAGFMRILTSEFVQALHGKMINIHPSLLPKYQGLHTHQRAIDAKDSIHGVSVHYVTPELDGGPVIAQSQCPILSNDTAESLAARVLTLEHELYPQVVQWFCDDKLSLHADGTVTLAEQPLPPSGHILTRV